jgi:CheY-like chemotaxis protein
MDHFSMRMELVHELISERRAEGRTLTQDELHAFFPHHERNGVQEIEPLRDAMALGGLDRETATILVVDDEPMMRDNLIDLLGFRGYTVLEAETGADAIAIATTHSEIEIMLLDIGLPDISGVDLAKSLKDILPHAEAIMLTAYQRLDLMIRSFDNLAYDYLTKPYNADELLNTISRALQRRTVLRLLEMPEHQKIIHYTVSFRTRAQLLQDLIDRRRRANKPVYMDDVFVFFPELRQPDAIGNQTVAPAHIKDGLLLYLYELEAQMTPQKKRG